MNAVHPPSVFAGSSSGNFKVSGSQIEFNGLEKKRKSTGAALEKQNQSFSENLGRSGKRVSKQCVTLQGDGSAKGKKKENGEEYSLMKEYSVDLILRDKNRSSSLDKKYIFNQIEEKKDKLEHFFVDKYKKRNH